MGFLEAGVCLYYSGRREPVDFTRWGGQLKVLYIHELVYLKVLTFIEVTLVLKICRRVLVLSIARVQMPNAVAKGHLDTG